MSNAKSLMLEVLNNLDYVEGNSLPIKTGDIVFVAQKHEILRISHHHRLAIAVKNLNKSRREIPLWICETICNYSGEIRFRDNSLFTPDFDKIDELCGGEDDPSYRFYSDFIKFADRPLLRLPKRTIACKLQMLDLAIRIEHPDIAENIAR